jgi:hypothetical protein
VLFLKKLHAYVVWRLFRRTFRTTWCHGFDTGFTVGERQGRKSAMKDLAADPNVEGHPHDFPV